MQPHPDFDEILYLDLNPDVEVAVRRGDFKSGLEHWEMAGRAEGRPYRPEHLPGPVPGAPEGWDEATYLRLNPDVGTAVRAGAISSGYRHWIKYGQDEGRHGGLSAFRFANPDEVLRNRPFGVNHFGFHGLKIGLSVASQGYLGLLGKIVPAVKSIVIPEWGREECGKIDFDPRQRPYAINVLHQNPDMMPFFLHRYGQKVLEEHINIGIWVWELHAGYAPWHAASRMFHEIWVASNWGVDALRSICAAPLVRVPYVVDGLPETAALSRADLGWPADKFVFLYVFDVGSTLERKNPMALIRAFRRAFANRSDVLLVLKYRRGEEDPTGVGVLERFAAASPNIRTIAKTMSETELFSLFQLSDCFVSPHRGEGFGLNIAQAMYYGKPVIATGYSGNMDFTNADNSFLLDYELISIDTDYVFYKKNYVWANPSVDHLAVLLEKVVSNRELAASVGRRGQATVRQLFSSAAVSALMTERLQPWRP